jgi:hypothetical protein
MKNMICLPVMLIMGIASMIAQKNYHDYSTPDAQFVFYDDFKKDVPAWEAPLIEWTKGEIKNGHYILENLRPPLGTRDRVVYVNEYRDFQIETSIKIISAGQNYVQGLDWSKSNHEVLTFGIVAGGDGGAISSYDVRGDKFTDYLPYKKGSKTMRPQGEYNKLTVRKVGQDYYFFLNEKLIHQMPFFPLPGEVMGFAADGAKIMVDYFYFCYLDGKTYPENTPAQEELSMDNIEKLADLMPKGKSHQYMEKNAWTWIKETDEGYSSELGGNISTLNYVKTIIGGGTLDLFEVSLGYLVNGDEKYRMVRVYTIDESLVEAILNSAVSKGYLPRRSKSSEKSLKEGIHYQGETGKAIVLYRLKKGSPRGDFVLTYITPIQKIQKHEKKLLDSL